MIMITRLLQFALPVALLIPVTLSAEDDQAAKDKEAVDAFSRAAGLHMGLQISGLDLDVDAAVEGFRQGLAASTKPPTPAEMKQLQQAHQQARNRPLEALSKPIIEAADVTSPGPKWKENQGLPAGEHDEFYKAYVAMKGVQTTASGLAYQVITPGEGAKPKATDRVHVHYTGRHTSGEIFDSSVKRGTPTSFGLDQVIRGWTEGVQLMPTGSTYRFVIPAKIAYGPYQPGSKKPTGVLIFDISLLKIN